MEPEIERRAEEIKSKLVIKAVRNVRRGYEADEAGRGMYMYRPRISGWTFKDRASSLKLIKTLSLSRWS